MSDVIIQELVPYLADIGIVFVFVSLAGVIIRLAVNSFTKGAFKL